MHMHLIIAFGSTNSMEIMVNMEEISEVEVMPGDSGWVDSL